MKVFIILSERQEDYCGCMIRHLTTFVFSTKDKAKEYLEKQGYVKGEYNNYIKQPRFFEHLYIEELEVI